MKDKIILLSMLVKETTGASFQIMQMDDGGIRLITRKTSGVFAPSNKLFPIYSANDFEKMLDDAIEYILKSRIKAEGYSAKKPFTMHKI